MAKWKVRKSRWVGMSLPWLVLDEHGEMVATFSTQQKAVAHLNLINERHTKTRKP